MLGIDLLPKSLAEWLGVYAAFVSSVLALHSLRKDKSRVHVRVRRKPNEYGDPDIIVAVIYSGGPPVPVKRIGFRMLRVAREDGSKYRYMIFGMPKYQDNVLRPEHREVELEIYANKDVDLQRLWFITVESAGNLKFRKLYRLVPPFWRSRRAFPPPHEPPQLAVTPDAAAPIETAV